jgi:hypothetical protein
VLAFAATLAVAGIAFAASPPPKVVVQLEPQPGSKIAGTATISHVSMDPPVVDVTILLDGCSFQRTRTPPVSTVQRARTSVRRLSTG